ncbi:MAG: hypothetical protein U1F61_27800 [Opitutaceae bacterium]
MDHRPGTLSLLLLSVSLLVGCGKSDSPAGVSGFQERAVRNNTRFVEQLDALGYFRQLAPDQIAARKQAFLREGWNALFSGPPHRLMPADAEDLTEGGMAEFFRLVQPFLVAEGVRLPEVRDELGSAGYVFHVGDIPHVIYTREEQLREANDELPGLTRGLSMARGFAILNGLLKAAGSSERAYAVGGDNDLFVFFLTPELFALITQHPDALPPEAPYVPTEAYPNFGLPEWQEGVAP